MKAASEVSQEFLTKLRALLKEYDAEMSAEDHYPGYPECGEDIYMTVDIPAVYDSEGECLREMTEIKLGGYFTAEP